MKNGILVAGLLLIATLTLIAVNERATVREIVEDKAVSGAASFDNKFVTFMNAGMIPDIVLNVDTRFIHKITKSQVHAAETVRDFFPTEAYDRVKVTNENRLVEILPDGDVEVFGSGEILTDEQRLKAQSLDHSSNFYLEANVKNNDSYSDKVVYFFTITPEKEAEYSKGPKALTEYLRKESTEASVGIKQANLRAGRVVFEVNAQGEVENVKLESTSGYSKFDERMVELIKDLPESWNPAENAKGEAVEQKLVLFFGTQGC